MKKIEVVHDGHVKRRRDRPFFFVTTYVKVAVIGAAIGQRLLPSSAVGDLAKVALLIKPSTEKASVRIVRRSVSPTRMRVT